MSFAASPKHSKLHVNNPAAACHHRTAGKQALGHTECARLLLQHLLLQFCLCQRTHLGDNACCLARAIHHCIWRYRREVCCRLALAAAQAFAAHKPADKEAHRCSKPHAVWPDCYTTATRCCDQALHTQEEQGRLRRVAGEALSKPTHNTLQKRHIKLRLAWLVQLLDSCNHAAQTDYNSDTPRAPHLSVWLVRLLDTSTSSHIQLPPSGATMMAARSPSSAATKLTSSTEPSCKHTKHEQCTILNTRSSTRIQHSWSWSRATNGGYAWLSCDTRHTNNICPARRTDHDKTTASTCSADTQGSQVQASSVCVQQSPHLEAQLCYWLLACWPSRCVHATHRRAVRTRLLANQLQQQQQQACTCENWWCTLQQLL
jgi:hypothetical protein